MSVTISDESAKKLHEVLSRLKSARTRWCAEEVDDAEEMWLDIPEMLDECVPIMEEAMKEVPRAG